MNIVSLHKDKESALDACNKFKQCLFLVPFLKELVVMSNLNEIGFVNGDQIYFCYSEFQICGMTIDKLEVGLNVPIDILQKFQIQTKISKSNNFHKDPVLLEITIEKCTQCPFYIWEQDISSSINDELSYCNKSNRILGNTRDPKIPIWCKLIKGEK